MDIRPNMPISALAGTARAQTEGADKDRSAAGGGVAENRASQENVGLNEGTRSEDRDADGRQMWEHQSRPADSEDEGPDGLPRPSDEHHDRSLTAGHEGTHLDIEA
jgi:hypothetical protein